jgi:hypothetical protein
MLSAHLPTLRRLGAPAALTALTLGCFHGVLGNGFVWDDRSLVVSNEALARADVVVRAFQLPTWRLADPLRAADDFYRPIGVLSLALDRSLGGLAPGVFHLHNLLLHVAVVLLLHLLLRRRGAAPGAALLGAAWFATLPASVETVSWIAVRFDLVGTVLALLALLAHRGPGRALRFTAPFLVLLATLTKEAFVVVPALLVLDDWLEERPAAVGPFLRAHLGKYGALAAVLAFSLTLRALVLGPRPGIVAGRDPLLLAVDGLTTVGGLARLAVAPLPLSITRPYHPAAPWALALVALGLLTVAVIAWRVRELRFGAAWFVLACVLPSLVVRPLGLLGERYLYVPALGLALAGAAGASLLRAPAPRRSAAAVVAAVVAMQAAAVAARVPAWRDDGTIFGAALDVDPESWLALFELGHGAARAGRWPEAAAWYRKALQYNQTDGRLLSNAAAAFESTGDHLGAVKVARLAVEVTPDNPRARYNLALSLVRLGQLGEARVELEEALRLAPDYARARALLEELPGGKAPARETTGPRPP